MNTRGVAVPSATPFTRGDAVPSATPFIDGDAVLSATPFTRGDAVSSATPFIDGDAVLSAPPFIDEDAVSSATPFTGGDAAPPSWESDATSSSIENFHHLTPTTQKNYGWSVPPGMTPTTMVSDPDEDPYEDPDESTPLKRTCSMQVVLPK